MPGAPHAQLLAVDLDYLVANELSLALRATLLPLLVRG
jgi:hypothetical protein